MMICELCRAATKGALLDARAFWAEVGRSGFLRLDDGNVWNLKRRCILTTVTREEKSEVLKLWRQNVYFLPDRAKPSTVPHSPPMMWVSWDTSSRTKMASHSSPPR